MKNVPSFEVSQNLPSSAERATPIPAAVQQRQRKVGFALSALLSSIGLAGCSSASATPEVVSYQASRQNFGTSPEGFIPSPTNSNAGYVCVGNNIVPVVRGANGWEAATEEYSRPRSIMNTTPDRFAPMTEFLARNNLSREDWIGLSEIYARTEVIDQQAEVEVTLLRGLSEHVQNGIHEENFDKVLKNYLRCLAALTLSRKLQSTDAFTVDDIARLEQIFESSQDLTQEPQLSSEETETQPKEPAPAAEETPAANEVQPTVEAPQVSGN